MQIKVGRAYRTAKPMNQRGFIGDRRVVFMNETNLKYRSPTTRGVWMSIAAFQRWAEQDITEHLKTLSTDWELAE